MLWLYQLHPALPSYDYLSVDHKLWNSLWQKEKQKYFDSWAFAVFFEAEYRAQNNSNAEPTTSEIVWLCIIIRGR